MTQKRQSGVRIQLSRLRPLLKNSKGGDSFGIYDARLLAHMTCVLTLVLEATNMGYRYVPWRIMQRVTKLASQRINCFDGPRGLLKPIDLLKQLIVSSDGGSAVTESKTPTSCAFVW